MTPDLPRCSYLACITRCGGEVHVPRRIKEHIVLDWIFEKRNDREIKYPVETIMEIIEFALHGKTYTKYISWTTKKGPFECSRLTTAKYSNCDLLFFCAIDSCVVVHVATI
jgi:hypothetical protein